MSRPDAPAVADAASQQVSAYAHIPFCRRVCPYCDFAVTDDHSTVDRYVAAIRSEVESTKPFDRPLDAIAIGGGTPTAIPASDIGSIVTTIGARFGVSADAEVSIEANPEDVIPAGLDDLRNAGVTRISLGVQSFDDAVLADLGRAHTAAEAVTAVQAALEAFASVNVDLIYGSPAESDEAWRRSVTTALGLGIQHLSIYALTVERGTPLSRAVNAGAPGPDPDAQADRWESGVAAAEDAGLIRYETSNLARTGHEVAYNLITWGQGDYAGFGVGAHRHRQGRRSWNLRRVDRYLERVEAGESPESDHEHIAGWDREVERVMLGIRRAAGVRRGPAVDALLESTEGAALRDAGVVDMVGERLVVTRPMLTDAVVRTLLAVESGDC